jgi:hypothetical protein
MPHTVLRSHWRFPVRVGIALSVSQRAMAPIEEASSA